MSFSLSNIKLRVSDVYTRMKQEILGIDEESFY